MILRQATYRVCSVNVKLGGGRRGGEGACRGRGAEAGGHDKKEGEYHAKMSHIPETQATSIRNKATGSTKRQQDSCVGLLL